MTLTVERTLQDAFIREPLALAIGQPHQVLISTISVSLTAEFFAAGDVLSRFVAYVGAVGVEYAYLKGLADSAYATRGQAGSGRLTWADGLIYTTCTLIVIAGTYVLLTKAFHVEAITSPHWFVALLLALAHIVPLAIIGLCSAQLHAGAERARLEARERAEAEAEERRRHERERAERLQLEEDERRRLRQLRLDEIEAQRLAKLADVEAMEAAANARQRVRQAFGANTPANSSPNIAPPVFAAPGSVANTPATGDRRALMERVANTLREQPNTKKAQLARELGIGRTTLYELIAEARAEGLLPQE